MSERAYMSGNANKEVADGLAKVLADSLVLYFKTHAFHWNVEGPQFSQLHALFEEQYTEMWQSIDEIAERIRALDVYAPMNFAEAVEQTSLDNASSPIPAIEMVRQLAADHAAITETIHAARKRAEVAGDEVTVDLMTQRLNMHEKAAWMLNSIAK